MDGRSSPLRETAVAQRNRDTAREQGELRGKEAKSERESARPCLCVLEPQPSPFLPLHLSSSSLRCCFPFTRTNRSRPPTPAARRSSFRISSSSELKSIVIPINSSIFSRFQFRVFSYFNHSPYRPTVSPLVSGILGHVVGMEFRAKLSR